VDANLEAMLGFTKEELRDRVVDRLCAQLMESSACDEDGEPITRASTFAREIQTHVKKRVDASIAALAEAHVLPNVSQYVENLVLTETNGWGEKRGKSVTFIEYLVERAEHYLLEKVDSEGRNEDERRRGGYSGRGEQTRITQLVDNHLRWSIKTAMEDALKIANGAIATGIAETVKLKLAEVVAGLQTTVAIKR